MAWTKRNPINTDKNEYDAPDRMVPIPERVAGVVFPYRGQEQHGVAPLTAPYVRGDDTWEIDNTEYEEPYDEPDPVAVRIVNEDTREIKGFAVQQTVVDSQQRIIAGANERRVRITVRNLDAAKTVFIGHDLTLSPATGYPIPFGQSFSLENVQTAVYGISADGTQVLIAICQERTVAVD